jgi:hypothetical protein
MHNSHVHTHAQLEGINMGDDPSCRSRRRVFGDWSFCKDCGRIVGNDASTQFRRNNMGIFFDSRLELLPVDTVSPRGEAGREPSSCVWPGEKDELSENSLQRL